MSQLSFFSAETQPPAVGDLAGLLAGPGQVVLSAGGRARISMVVDADWRATALARLIHQAGLGAEITRSEEGRPLVRTASVPELVQLGRAWTKGAVKAVPAGWTVGPRGLRAWALAAGRTDGVRYLLGLDPHAPDTHEPLAAALARVGITSTPVGIRAGGPALRISGRRRLLRLRENVGEMPAEAPIEGFWPNP
ncbi:hypothetical protein G4X40_04305 [Rhodococcus sp. D2-41]|uniref:Uncharacterized protein n=1 Tax=Speluncibacter jeojiensis TaxID=2710754 RepID=A0A9X4M3A2_9ACTN|nr:hypothetical protein [Rhodococcus sp. D2-41]MDG3009366.1 hypothetical protein [Rhodococcus sp. D2-41]MDG3017079.1 hypothetical protein [Corynebacteriales bacterium D3-21]